MLRSTSLERLAVEIYLPADIVRDLDDNRYFDEHPRYKETPLQPTAPPFCPIPRNKPSLKLKCVPPRSIDSTTHSPDVSPPPCFVYRPLAPPAPAFPNPLFSELSSPPQTYATRRLCEELMKFVTPSGPRLSGEGTQDHIQGILQILALSERVLLVQMTLLVAGFIIGPAGDSIRSIMAKSGAAIYSYTEFISEKKCRVFYIEGSRDSIEEAMDIMTQAVARYKDLAEGKYKGKEVDKKQLIQGIEFIYQPPPKTIVPFAAALRTERSERIKRRSRNKN